MCEVWIVSCEQHEKHFSYPLTKEWFLRRPDGGCSVENTAFEAQGEQLGSTCNVSGLRGGEWLVSGRVRWYSSSSGYVEICPSVVS